MRLLRAFLIAFVLLASGCTSGSDQPADQPQTQPEPTAIAKVKVDRAGTIFLDGTEVTVDELKQAFARLKQEGGAVWYYREDPQGEPMPETAAVVEAVLNAVIAAELPIRLLEEDFE